MLLFFGIVKLHRIVWNHFLLWTLTNPTKPIAGAKRDLANWFHCSCVEVQSALRHATSRYYHGTDITLKFFGKNVDQSTAGHSFWSNWRMCRRDHGLFFYFLCKHALFGLQSKGDLAYIWLKLWSIQVPHFGNSAGKRIIEPMTPP